MKNKIIVAIFILTAFILGCFLGNSNFFYGLKYVVAKKMFCEVERQLVLDEDVNFDGIKEEIVFMKKSFPFGNVFSESSFIVKNKTKMIYQSADLGCCLESARICDINNDNIPELVTKWVNPTTKSLYIFQFGKQNFNLLFFAEGKEVALRDIDNDGILEVMEYMRNYEKKFNTYEANVYKFNGKEYELFNIKQHHQ